MARGIKTGGRRKGTPNRITRAFREAVQVAYDAIGGDEAFSAWARENPGDFYKIAARLIPAEVVAREKPDNALRVVLVNFREEGGRVVEVLHERQAVPKLPDHGD